MLSNLQESILPTFDGFRKILDEQNDRRERLIKVYFPDTYNAHLALMMLTHLDLWTIIACSTVESRYHQPLEESYICTSSVAYYTRHEFYG